MGIVEFLNARLDDDEAYARMAFAEHNDATPEWSEPWSGSVLTGPREDPILTFDSGISRHMVRHDPARVLREVAAKRPLLTQHRPASAEALHPWCRVCIRTDPEIGTYQEPFPCPTLRVLAVSYADHPDYQEAWKL